MEIIAHRGASFDAPENTLAAFRQGFEQGADVNELDIHLSRDGLIVVTHDFTVHRIAGVDKAVRELDLAELKALDAGRWKDPKWAGEKIPTLDEVARLLPPGKRLFLEIKCGAEILPELDRVFNANPALLQQSALIGFNHDTLHKAKSWFTCLPVYWLSAFKPDPKSGGLTPSTDELIQRAQAGRFDGLNLLFTGPIDEAFMQKARAAKLKVYVWTLDDPVIARKMAQLGVDGLATNRPGWLREKLAN